MFKLQILGPTKIILFLTELFGLPVAETQIKLAGGGEKKRNLLGHHADKCRGYSNTSYLQSLSGTNHFYLLSV